MDQLRERVAIVTGASSGIGRAVARRFAEEGATVVACARRRDRLHDLASEVTMAGGTALAVECDVADETQIDGVVTAAVERFGRIDILANFAQGGMETHAESFLGSTTKDEVVASYLTGPVQNLLFMQKAFPYMKAQQYGRIINVSSNASNGVPGMLAYGMAKASVRTLTRAASIEWGEFGIVTNAVIPVVYTESWDYSERTKHYAGVFGESIPVRRLGLPYEDLAPLVTFLASESAGYINGQVISIDGGAPTGA